VIFCTKFIKRQELFLESTKMQRNVLSLTQNDDGLDPISLRLDKNLHISPRNPSANYNSYNFSSPAPHLSVMEPHNFQSTTSPSTLPSPSPNVIATTPSISPNISQTFVQHYSTQTNHLQKPVPETYNMNPNLTDSNGMQDQEMEDGFETEFGDELSFLVETRCSVEGKQEQFMPYIY